PAVDGDADRARKILGPAAKPARLGAVVAERQERLAVRREFLDAAELPLGGEDGSFPVEGEEVRSAGAVLRPVDAIKLTRLRAIFAPFAQEFSLRREALHAAIDLIRDVDGAVPANRNAAGLIELAVALAELAPFAQELAGLVVHTNLVAHHRRDVDGACFVD